MANLKPNEQEFYSKLENTFLSSGWDLLSQGWKEEQQQLPIAAFFNAQTMDDLRAARVRYGLLDELINLPEAIAQQKLNVMSGEESE